MSPDDEQRPQRYEAGPPTEHDEVSEDERGRPPTREELEEHNEKLARSRRPMGPEVPEDDVAREAPLEEAPEPDVPPTPPPEPADR